MNFYIHDFNYLYPWRIAHPTKSSAMLMDISVNVIHTQNGIESVKKTVLYFNLTQTEGY